MPEGQKRALGLLTDGCEPPCGCWELNSVLARSWGRLFPTSLRNHHSDSPRGWNSLHSHQQCRSINKLLSAVQDWLYVDLPFTPSPWAPERGWGLLQGILCTRLPWEPTLSLPPVPGYISGIGGAGPLVTKDVTDINTWETGRKEEWCPLSH